MDFLASLVCKKTGYFFFDADFLRGTQRFTRLAHASVITLATYAERLWVCYTNAGSRRRTFNLKPAHDEFASSNL
jgi:hypothetical protein